MGKFGEWGGETFSPMYGGIDWHLRQLIVCEDIPLPVAYVSEDGLTQQITHENTSIYLNRVAPELDMLAHIDPRDGLEWLWFREDDPDVFKKLVIGIGALSLVVTTEYPCKDVVDAYLRRIDVEIEAPSD